MYIVIQADLENGKSFLCPQSVRIEEIVDNFRSHFFQRSHCLRSCKNIDEGCSVMRKQSMSWYTEMESLISHLGDKNISGRNSSACKNMTVTN